MTDHQTNAGQRDDGAFLDVLLRNAVPEIKLALGDVIDRENARVLPAKYAKLLPETLLVVTLRPDAAEALSPVAAALERELTDSCTRHGSLYDRAYRVQLRRSEDPDAPLYVVGGHAGRDLAAAPHEDLPAVEQDREAGVAESARRERDSARRPESAAVASAEARPLPLADPDATRLGVAGPPGWQAGRWILIVQDEDGSEREVFRLTDPFVTVGRSTSDPDLRTSIAISEAPHVSRRQLAMVWEERDGAPGFRLYNLGLNPVHLPGQEIQGAHVGKGSLDLDSIANECTGWLPPGVPLRIGEHGPTLRIDEVPQAEEDEEEMEGEAEAARDPDATVYE